MRDQLNELKIAAAAAAIARDKWARLPHKVDDFIDASRRFDEYHRRIRLIELTGQDDPDGRYDIVRKYTDDTGAEYAYAVIHDEHDDGDVRKHGHYLINHDGETCLGDPYRSHLSGERIREIFGQ